MDITDNLIIDSYKILQKHFNKQFLLAKTKLEMDWLNLKYAHSIDVYMCMVNLIQNEEKLNTLSKENQTRLLVGALLHDIGRFYQFKNNEIQRHLNHGDMGKQILIEDENFDDEYILLFVKLHEAQSKIEDEPFFQSLNEEEKKFATLGLQAVEDSDIVANLQKFPEQNTFYTFLNEKRTYEPIISDEIINATLEGRHFKGKILSRSIFDGIAIEICIIRLLKYEHSKNVCNKFYLAKFVYERLEKTIETSFKQKLISDNDFKMLSKKANILKECLIEAKFKI
ncbi:MAG: HD domain-containing protein [Bdellovibrionota bacterium]